MLKPAILARDPDLIKDILITNFNSFRDNDNYLSKKHDPLTATNPFFVRDDEWRESRKTLMPAFSQNKVKYFLFHLDKRTLFTKTNKYLFSDEKYNADFEWYGC